MSEMTPRQEWEHYGKVIASMMRDAGLSTLDLTWRDLGVSAENKDYTDDDLVRAALAALGRPDLTTVDLTHADTPDNPGLDVDMTNEGLRLRAR